MDDNRIIELYWERNEEAIRETSNKYGKLCHKIAGNVLKSREDVEECVSDTYLGCWNAMPREWPARLPVFIGKIARNLALKKHEYNSAQKRSSDAVSSIEELCDVVSGGDTVETELESRRIDEAINAFLGSLDREKRSVFLARYWLFEPIEVICEKTGYSQSKVKSMLFGLRKKLRAHLEREGVEL